jgi:hypothetical protein
MLKICQTPLPQTWLSYIAFRVAFGETFGQLSLNLHFGGDDSQPFGYLCEVPFLQEVAPAVQLDLLTATWQKHHSEEEHQSNLLDESVIYAACETTARLVETEPDSVVEILQRGPVASTVAVDPYLAREVRTLYLQLPSEADFLIISQYLDMDPDRAIKSQLEIGIDPKQKGPLFDALGRWHVQPQMTSRLGGLLTDHEATQVAATLKLLRQPT